jgi:hypothetical protein
VETRLYLDANQEAYLAARARARAWIDPLEVEPADLRAHGIKGKKKLVEKLDTYVWLLRDPLEGEREELVRLATLTVAPTRQPGYHDMNEVDDRQFKQDATSYMRAAYLMDGLGLDTTDYVRHMREVLPRYDAHMPDRGPAQQMIFHIYYEHFGFEEPFPLDEAFEKGQISSRPDPRTIGRMPMYHLTHEIFMPYRYGEVRTSTFFDSGDIAYLREALPVLVERRIEARDPDLVGELALCLEYLDMEDLPAFRQAIAFLLETQNGDGSWGRYPEADARLGAYARQHIYLHTTKLALTALVSAFRCPG